MTTTRRGFLGWLAALPAARRWDRLGSAPPPAIEVRPSALYQQPDGRRNLVRITVAGLDSPAARARVTDRHGALVGTAGLLPSAGAGGGQGLTLAGEVWVPLSEPSDFEVELEIGKQRVAKQRVRLAPPRRWTIYWIASNHTDIGYNELQEPRPGIHRQNHGAALARVADPPAVGWAAGRDLPVNSYVQNRCPQAAEAVGREIR